MLWQTLFTDLRNDYNAHHVDHIGSYNGVVNGAFELCAALGAWLSSRSWCFGKFFYNNKRFTSLTLLISSAVIMYFCTIGTYHVMSYHIILYCVISCDILVCRYMIWHYVFDVLVAECALALDYGHSSLVDMMIHPPFVTFQSVIENNYLNLYVLFCFWNIDINAIDFKYWCLLYRSMGINRCSIEIRKRNQHIITSSVVWNWHSYDKWQVTKPKSIE